MKLLRAGELKHAVDVMRPATGPKSSRGLPHGNATTVIKNWPCKITPTGGSESDSAGGPASDRTYEVEGYTDPKNPIRSTDFLVYCGRRFDIAGVFYPEMNGQIVSLTCGEAGQPAEVSVG